MALLDVPTASAVGAPEIIEQFTGPAAETITAGQYVRLNTTTGFVELGNATTPAEGRPGGFALNSATAGMPVTVVRQGLMDLGDILGALTYDDDVYLSDTDGRLADVQGVEDLIVGTVVTSFGHATAASPDKLLRVNL